MKDPLKPVEIKKFILRGIDHIINSVDRERDCRPYFKFYLSASLVELGQKTQLSEAIHHAKLLIDVGMLPVWRIPAEHMALYPELEE